MYSNQISLAANTATPLEATPTSMTGLVTIFNASPGLTPPTVYLMCKPNGNTPTVAKVLSTGVPIAPGGSVSINDPNSGQIPDLALYWVAATAAADVRVIA